MNSIKARYILISIKLFMAIIELGIAGVILLYLIKHTEIIWK